MKIYYSFKPQQQFNEDLNKIKTNFDITDKRHLEWIAEQCIDECYSPTDPDIPKQVKLWRKNGEELGVFNVILENRPVLQARMIVDNSLD